MIIMHEHNTIVPLSRRSRLQKNQEQRIYDSFQTFRSKVEATARYIEREQETLRKNLKSSDHYFDSHIKRIEDLIRKISNIALNDSISPNRNPSTIQTALVLQQNG